jgi:hypothetical protein
VKVLFNVFFDKIKTLNMKKLFALLLSVSIATMAMGQQVVNGVLQGSPRSFMYLTPQTGSSSSSWNDSWVKPSYSNTSESYSSTFNYTQNMGIRPNSSNFSHRFVVTPDSTVSPANDACFRNCQNTPAFNMPIMADAWNSDQYSGTYVDTVIQMGMSGSYSSSPSGIYSQQMLYSFVPDLENPVLLLQFTFVTEDAMHSQYADNPGVEFAVLQHGTNNYLSLGNYDWNHPYSRFWFRTPGSNGTSDPDNTPVNVTPMCCPVQSGCQCQSGVNNTYTYPYTIVAYDLSSQARSHTAVDFRVRVHACTSRYHWAYCYFTAKMIPAELKVEYCGGDSLNLSIPWGFDVNTYQWYNGVDSATTNASNWFDPDDPSSSTVVQGSTKYNPILRPDPAKPYYRCMVQSYTGIPFTYQATVRYYDLKPSFTMEPKALTGERHCDYGVVLHNTSQIGIIAPDGNGGVDTTWQDLELNPEQCTWDFGDGSPVVHGFEPEHVYTQPGTYHVSLYIEDYERICKSATIDTTITLLPEYMEKQYAADTVSTCEGKLPYYYKPELFGYDNVTTRWDLNAVGDRQVNYSSALDQYNIRSWNGCDSIVRVRFDVLTPAVTIHQRGDFCDSAQTTLVANVNNVQQNAVEYTWTFMDSVMSTTDEMLAMSDGTYSVSIVDRSTECEAAATYKIEPCVPNIFLPNCITPTRSQNEGPVQNDYFYLDQFVLRFITDVKFMVYSRNGEEVFYYEGKKNVAGDFYPPTPYGNLPTEMDGRLVLWDGKVNGNIVSSTYVYTLWIVSGGKTYLYKGKLTVM